MYSVSCQLHTVHTVLFIRYMYVSQKNCLFGKYTLTDVHHFFQQNLELKKKSAVVNANAKSALQDAIDAQEAHDTQEAEVNSK